jgi:hypothetical protein
MMTPEDCLRKWIFSNQESEDPPFFSLSSDKESPGLAMEKLTQNSFDIQRVAALGLLSKKQFILLISV